MKPVIIRSDDIHGATRPEELWRLYAPCWEKGWPICLAVIPKSQVTFRGDASESVERLDIRHNQELVRFVDDLHSRGLVEIALHGWRHHPDDLTEGGRDAIGERLAAGLELLGQAWPDSPVRILVPPFERVNPETLHAARQLGLDLCTTWAGTRGGTRLAHWWGRWRRARGLHFGTAASGLWPTDIEVADFQEDEDAWPLTEHLLGLAQRWRSPAIFVQHYWRFLDDGARPNARHARWLSWLERLMATPGVFFRTFYDG